MYRTSEGIVAIFVSTVLLFGGCSGDPKTTALRSFEKHVKNIATGLPSVKDGFTYDPSSVKYDVEETKSLVSPFTGKLLFESKLLVNDQKMILVNQEEAIFALQDGKWKLQSRSRTKVKIANVAGGEVEPGLHEFMSKAMNLGVKEEVTIDNDQLNKLLRGE